MEKLKSETTDLSTLSKGQVVWGSIDKITVKGCEIMSLYPIRGYVSIKNFPSHNILDPKAIFEEGQTVRYSVLSVPEANSHQMVIGSLKPSLCPVYDTSYLQNYFNEVALLNPDSVVSESLLQRIGSIVWVKIQKTTYFGATVKFCVDNKELKAMTGVVLKDHMSESEDYQAGSTFSAKILDIDFSKKVVDLSLTSLSPVSETVPIPISVPTKANLELIKSNYLVLTLADTSHVVYASPLDKFQASFPFSVYTQGMQFEVIIPEVQKDKKILCYIASDSDSIKEEITL